MLFFNDKVSCFHVQANATDFRMFTNDDALKGFTVKPKGFARKYATPKSHRFIIILSH